MSTDGGATWQAAVKVTTAMTDETIAGADSGNQFGDYNSLSGYGNAFFPSWTDRRNNAKEEIWTAKITTSTTPTYSISGNAGTTGATVTAGSASATSDGSSNYTISNLAAGTYTVTPSKSGCTFSPASSSVTITSANVTGINFTASCTAPTFTISGNVGTSGATVTAGTSSTTSDASSNYSMSGFVGRHLHRDAEQVGLHVLARLAAPSRSPRPTSPRTSPRRAAAATRSSPAACR